MWPPSCNRSIYSFLLARLDSHCIHILSPLIHWHSQISFIILCCRLYHQYTAIVPFSYSLCGEHWLLGHNNIIGTQYAGE
jgi:hypothetical protein